MRKKLLLLSQKAKHKLNNNELNSLRTIEIGREIVVLESVTDSMQYTEEIPRIIHENVVHYNVSLLSPTRKFVVSLITISQQILFLSSTSL